MTSASLASRSLLAVLLFASPAFAQAPTASTATAPVASAARAPGADATAVTQPAAPASAPALPAVGMMVDAGLPDGMNAALVYRPTDWLRTHAGGSYNMISYGVRGGIALIPFGSGPSAILEAGHYFDGNANGLARKIAGAGFQNNALLEKIGYDYANAHLGLDLGKRRVTFYIHGGMSYFRATVHNLDTVVQNEAAANGGDTASTTVSIKKDPIIRAWTPSAKIGLIVYLW